MMHSTEVRNEESVLLAEIECIWKEEEALLCKRAKVNWLQQGDRNSKFFHAAVRYRKQRNQITKLQDDQGIWISDPEKLKDLAISFFSDLFVETL
ncbi:hypothetical protein LINPERHAP2_LOCUS24999 [Linum perenne]